MKLHIFQREREPVEVVIIITYVARFEKLSFSAQLHMNAEYLISEITINYMCPSMRK